MGYPYEDLSEGQFEALVLQVSKLQLGKGVQGFAAGVDGGRDARFEGLADGFPSRTRPWEGITVIQAKHTMSYGYFSDPDFSGTSSSSVLTLELPRAKKLYHQGKLQNYLLYSNRYLTANANEKILEYISEQTGIPSPSIHLCGIEALDEAFRLEPQLDKLAGINPLDGPLVPSSRELAEVVEAISSQLDSNQQEKIKRPLERTSLVKKNELNSMTEKTSHRLMNYYGHLLSQIQKFLADPGNNDIRNLYVSCAEEFNLKILAHKEPHHTFDKAFGHIVDMLVRKDRVLGRNSRLTRAMVFYMYWNCDIGESEEKDDDFSYEV